MSLEQSVVFRQLERGGRFAQFDLVDAAIVLIVYQVHYMAEFFLGGSLLRPWVTLVAAAVAVYFLRARLPEGLTPLLHVLSTPRHLSSLAPDSMLGRYPPAGSAREAALRDGFLPEGSGRLAAFAPSHQKSPARVFAASEARSTPRSKASRS